MERIAKKYKQRFRQRAGSGDEHTTGWREYGKANGWSDVTKSMLSFWENDRTLSRLAADALDDLLSA